MATIAQHTAYSRQFLMVSSTDHLTGQTSETVTLTISKAGGAFATPAGAVTEIGNGWYQVALTNADTNTAGDLVYHATGASSDATDFADQVITQAQLNAQQVGSTSSYAPTRNALLTMAYRKAGLIASGQTLSGIQLSEGIEALNLLLREMDVDGPNVHAYGSAPSSIVLQENIGIYTSAEGLPTNIVEIISATMRGGTGTDTPLTIHTTASFEEDIANKFTTGTPTDIYLNRSRNPASHSLYVYPLPSNVGTQSEVTGSDALNYSCIRSHTSATANKPVTGANWRLFWEQTGSSGAAWVVDTAYVAPALIRLWYKRPLADFTAANDNPDLFVGSSRMLVLRLAEDLSVDAGRDVEFSRRLERMGDKAEARIFRHTRKEKTTNVHNRTKFY